jgi:hypothetical protein
VRGLAGLIIALSLTLSTGISSAQTPEQQAAIERAEQIGRELYEHDRAAWLATDAMFAELDLSRQGNVRGWATRRDGDAIVVAFVDGSTDGELRGIYRATYVNGALTAHGVSNDVLTDLEARLYRARTMSLEALTEPCAPRYNTVALPRLEQSADGVDVDVYLMPGTTDANMVPVGGYFRYGVDADANQIIDRQPFARSCLTLSRANPNMERVAALFFTHVLSATPTETHVFINLVQGVPLFVGTSAGVWGLQEGRVSLARGPQPQ